MRATHFALSLLHFQKLSPNKMLQLAYFLWILHIALGVAKEDLKTDYSLTADSPMVHESLGLVLLPSSILAQSTSMVLQSVFLKLESPQPPSKMCNLACSPKIEEIRELLTPLDGCWIEKMAVVKAGILEDLDGLEIEVCCIRCLLNSLCGAITYDHSRKNCILRSGNFYRVNAIDENLNSITAKMSCIYENHNTSRTQLCGQGNDLYFTVLEAMKNEHQLLMDRYFTKYQDVKKAYDLNTSYIHSVRHKRGIGWSDFDFLSDIPILGHFYEVLKSPSENRKLKDHLKKLSDKFLQFVSVVSEEFESSRRYNQEVLEMVDAGFAQVYRDIRGLKCDIASLASLTIFQQSLKMHSSKLDELFFASKHGKLQANLPQILSLADLELIISENPNFENTLFKDHPEILYRVGDLYLLDALKNSKDSLFHFLLTTPKLVPDSLFRTYHPVQVPTTTSATEEEMCFLPQIPNTVIVQLDKLVAADITDCHVKEQVILCQQDFADSFSPTTEIIPCLNGQPELCQLKPASCEPHMIFTKAGALVFSKETILGMPVGETSKLSILNVDGKFSYFFSWTEYKMIQSKQKVMYSPNNRLVVKNLTWKTRQNFLEFNKLLKTTSVNLIASNISKLKKDLDNVTSIAMLDFTPDFMGLGISRRTWTDATGTFSLICTLLSVTAPLFLCCYKRVKQSNRIVKLVLEQMQTEKAVKRLERVKAKPTMTTEDFEDITETLEAEPLVTKSEVKSLKRCTYKRVPDSQKKPPPIQLEARPAEEQDITASVSSSDSQSPKHSTHDPDTENEERPVNKKPNVKSDVKNRKSNLKNTKVIDAFGSQ